MSQQEGQVESMTAHTTKRRKKRKSKTQRCRVCNKLFKNITPEHLRTHNITLQRYRRLFGATMPPSTTELMEVGSVSDPQDGLVSAVSERLLQENVWVGCLADEVGERMTTGPMRHRLSLLLTTMLHQRAKVHGQSMSVLCEALNELQESWRITQGGPDGQPTSTEELLRIVDRGTKLVQQSEEAVMRAMKVALEEQRLQTEHADSLGPALYQGTGETLAMPDLPTGDREIMRALLGMVSKHASEANTIDASHTPGADGVQTPVDGVVSPSQHRDGAPTVDAPINTGESTHQPQNTPVSTSISKGPRQGADGEMLIDAALKDPTVLTRTRTKRRRKRHRDIAPGGIGSVSDPTSRRDDATSMPM